MKLAVLSALLASATAFAPAQTAPKATVAMSETSKDLEALAQKLNPKVGFYDPLNLAQGNFWGMGEEATIGFLRQSEIKHGRIAMFAFVGYCVQSNVHFPWAESLSGAAHPSVDLVPEAQWDAVPSGAKWQIFAVISALELWDECGGGDLPHYTKGRKPGQFPSFKGFRDAVHPVFDLYDPAGFNKNMSEETKEKRLRTEINNGRLAMLGLFAFLCADKIPGSVPLLSGIAMPYEGQVMNPFEGQFSYLNF